MTYDEHVDCDKELTQLRAENERMSKDSIETLEKFQKILDENGTLEFKNNTLRTENAQLKDHHELFKNEVALKMDQLLNLNKRLLEGLEKHGKHRESCASRTLKRHKCSNMVRSCDCGFDTLIAEAEEALK